MRKYAGVNKLYSIIPMEPQAAPPLDKPKLIGYITIYEIYRCLSNLWYSVRVLLYRTVRPVLLSGRTPYPPEAGFRFRIFRGRPVGRPYLQLTRDMYHVPMCPVCGENEVFSLPGGTEYYCSSTCTRIALGESASMVEEYFEDEADYYASCHDTET